LSYADRLIKVGLPSLELRRLQIDLIYCYKIVFGPVKINVDDFLSSLFLLKLPEGMCTSCTNPDAVMQ